MKKKISKSKHDSSIKCLRCGMWKVHPLRQEHITGIFISSNSYISMELKLLLWLERIVPKMLTILAQLSLSWFREKQKWEAPSTTSAADESGQFIWSSVCLDSHVRVAPCLILSGKLVCILVSSVLMIHSSMLSKLLQGL